MPFSHVLLVLLVVVVWGINFLFSKVALELFPPFLLCAVRFFLASVPVIFFVKYPKGALRQVALYGFVMFVLQFGMIFWSIAVGMPPGLAALIMQLQVFFSMLFAALFLNETPSIYQVFGAVISFFGIVLVGLHVDGNMTLLAFMLMLGGAASLGLGNFVTKKLQGIEMSTLIIWGSFLSCIPMLFLSLAFEGPDRMVYVAQHLEMSPLLALLYIVYASTWVGYGGWNFLLNRYPIGTIVPFTLLVPVVSIIGSVLFLNESFEHWKLIASLFVLSGLFINIFGSRFTRWINTRRSQVVLEDA